MYELLTDLRPHDLYGYLVDIDDTIARIRKK